MARSRGAEALDRGGGWVVFSCPLPQSPPPLPAAATRPLSLRPAHSPLTGPGPRRGGGGRAGRNVRGGPPTGSGRLCSHRPCPSRSRLPRALPDTICKAPRQPRLHCEAPAPHGAPTRCRAPFQMLYAWPPSPTSFSKLVDRGAERPLLWPRQPSSGLRRRKLHTTQEGNPSRARGRLPWKSEGTLRRGGGWEEGWRSRNPSDRQPEGPARGGASRHHRTPSPAPPPRSPFPPFASSSARPAATFWCYVILAEKPERIPTGLGPGMDGSRFAGRPALSPSSQPLPQFSSPGPHLAASGLRPREYPHPWIPERRTLLTPPPPKTLLTLPRRAAFPEGRKRVRCAPLADALPLQAAGRERLLSPRGRDGQRWPGS